MKSPPMSHAVPASTRSGWGSFEHRLLKRRAAGSRVVRRGRSRPARRFRDAIEISRGGRRGLRLLARFAIVTVAALAVVDLFDDAPPVHLAALVCAVILAG